MGDFLYFSVVIIISAIGGVIGNKIKLPAGGMLGAMIAVIVFNIIIQPTAVMPLWIPVALQLAFGPLLGSRLSKADILGMKKLAFPALVMVVCMLVINVILGITIYFFSNLHIATTLFSAAPGGMMDMAIISEEFGANPAYVAIMQLSRLMFIFIFMIPFYKKLMIKLSGTAKEDLQCAESEVSEGLAPLPSSPYRRAGRYIMTAVCGCVLGLFMRALGVPAGAIIGSMLGSAAFNIFSGKAYFPPSLRLPFQIAGGTFVGMRMDRYSLLAMNEMIVPLIILFIGIVVMTAVTAYVIHKLAGLDPITSLLASTPGGLSEMAIIADDLGANPPKVAVLHMARLMSVIIFFPTMLAVVLRILEWLR